MSGEAWDPFLAGDVDGGTGKNGVIAINVSYWVRTIRQAISWVPADLVTTFGLPLVRRQFRQEWGNGKTLALGIDGAYLLTFSLEGVENPTDDPANIEFDSDGTLGEEAIEKNPNIELLMEKYSGSPDDSGRRIVFAPDVEADGVSMPNPLFGQEEYSVPSIAWTRSYVCLHPSPDVTSRLGKLDRPPSAPGGYLPHASGRRNWLKVVGKVRWRGNVWQVTETWQMSPEGGFNRDVYR